MEETKRVTPAKDYVLWNWHGTKKNFIPTSHGNSKNHVRPYMRLPLAVRHQIEKECQTSAPPSKIRRELGTNLPTTANPVQRVTEVHTIKNIKVSPWSF